MSEINLARMNRFLNTTNWQQDNDWHTDEATGEESLEDTDEEEEDD